MTVSCCQPSNLVDSYQEQKGRSQSCASPLQGEQKSQEGKVKGREPHWAKSITPLPKVVTEDDGDRKQNSYMQRL